MKKLFCLKRGMSFIEYTVLCSIIAASLLGMQILFKRALCGRWQENGKVFGFGKQYDDVQTTTNFLLW